MRMSGWDKEEGSKEIREGEHWLHITVWNRIVFLLRWLLLAGVTGVVLGAAGSLFGMCVNYVTEMRAAYPWLLFGLPLGGLVIVWMYQWERKQTEKSSTNLVLDAIHAGTEIPVKTAPLIFASTVVTHLFGGSAGREGAALQLGGSIGNFLGKLFPVDDEDRRIVIMCGMSAAFSALFGTPIAAAVFSMEVASVGIMQYAALVPCVVASFAASGIAGKLGLVAEHFELGILPAFDLPNAGKVLLLGLACAAVSILFCVVLHQTEGLFQKWFPNPYLRAASAGALVIVLTVLLGTSDYLGAGMDIVERAMEGNVFAGAFLLKMLFTAVTLAGGFKGGEIVPTFFIGASFGCLAGSILKLAPSLGAACGMAAVFCGVTNCPITALLISFEMFGYEGAPFFLLAVAVSYMQSGYYGLYHSQKIVYSKVRPEKINRSIR